MEGNQPIFWDFFHLLQLGEEIRTAMSIKHQFMHF